MTEQEQRIAIAEFCGMKPLAENEGVRKVWIETFGQDLGPWINVKDYLHDLNAMHDAEAFLVGDSQIGQYLGELLKIVELGWRLCRATAAQRAEALLKAIGRWKD